MYVFGSGQCGRRVDKRIGLSFTNPVETWGVLDVCQCLGCGDVFGVGREWMVGLGQGLYGRGGVMSV